MAKIQINNPRQIINGGAKKYYFKVKGLGGPKGDKGDKGDTGATGPQGPQGNAATVSVGSTTTLPVGHDATVTNSGSIYNAVLDFGIPQGPQGPQGAKGDKGDTGAQGETGPRGPQGERGTNATVYVGTTTTTNPGTQARVYNSGTDSNAVLNFEIPRGDVGPQPELVQTTGTSTTKAMSQNATTVALAAKQNTLTAGANIQISNGTISATDTTYTAGNGLNLNGTEFSADTTVLATKSDLNDYYTKPETDTKLAPKLEAEVVAELPTTGEEGKLYLTPKAHTTQTATGNPITATITEQAGKMESFRLDGDTAQQTYTGKNLLNIPTTTTNRGVTFTKNGDTLTIAGTATTTYAIGGKVNKTLPAGTYTLSISSSLPYAFGAGFYYTSDGTRHALSGISAGSTSKTFSLPEEANELDIYVSGLTADTALTPATITVQLESGSEVTTFEPYVGGVPAPNPDYPQAVNTVTGRQVVKVEGKNLFDATKAETTLDGITYSGDNEALYLDGSIAHDQGIAWGNVPLSAGTYTLTLELVSGSFTTTSTTGALFYVYGDNISISPQNPNLTPSNPKLSIAVTVSADTTNAHITSWTRNTEHFDNAVIKYQLVKGETADYDFEPHKVEDYEINLGKNLINIPYSETEWLGARVLQNGTTLTMKPNSTGGIGLSYSSSVIDIAIPAGETITWSRTWLGGGTWSSGSFTFPLELAYSDGTTESITMEDTTKNNYLNVLSETKTLEKDVVSVKIVNALCYSVKGLSEETTFGLQLELGSEATSYAAYFTPIELCKLGTYQDYIYKDGDDWKVHKATASYRITGQESDLEVNTLQANTTRFFSNTALTATGAAPGNNKALSVCNRLPLERNWSEDVVGIYVNERAFVGRMNKTVIGTTIAEARSYFANNPTLTCYQLATPTDTAITDQNLIAQLEAVRTALLQNGANTITNSATGSNLAGDMEIGYYGYNPRNRYDKWLWLDLNNAYEQLNNPDTSPTLSALSTRSLGATTEQPTVTRSLETETITLKKGETEPIEDKTELPTILDEEAEEAEETETTEPEESDGTDER